jgi:hypothetical protein
LFIYTPGNIIHFCKLEVKSGFLTNAVILWFSVLVLLPELLTWGFSN